MSPLLTRLAACLTCLLAALAAHMLARLFDRSVTIIEKAVRTGSYPRPILLWLRVRLAGWKALYHLTVLLMAALVPAAALMFVLAWVPA